MNPFNVLSLPFESIAACWTGQYETRGRLSEADCVLGLSFGYRGKGKNIQPGLSNQDIANVALKSYPQLHKILQFEIADAYEASGGEMSDVDKISHHRIRGRYLDTREVVEQAKIIMDKQRLSRPVLLAHPNHMPRVQLVCDKLGIDWIATNDLVGAVEFDPLSSQKWTRDIDQWRGYEPLAMTFYALKGWI